MTRHPESAKTLKNGVWCEVEVGDILSAPSEMIRLTAKELGEDGEADKPFNADVHKELLCFFSPYYRAALKGGFSEAQNKSLVLEMDDMRCRMFRAWLYSGRLTGWIDFEHYSLYIFAEQTENLALRRAFMTETFNWTPGEERLPRFEQISLALNSLPSSSPLYRWLEDVFVHHWNPKTWTAEEMAGHDTFPHEFVFNVVKRLAVLRGREHPHCPCCVNACNYHEHESIEEWESTCKSVNNVKTPPDEAFLKNSKKKEQGTDGPVVLPFRD